MAIRKDKGGLFLYDKAIYLDRGQNCWRYKADNEEVSDKEFWIPQKPSRPPNHAFLHKATNTFYQKKNKYQENLKKIYQMTSDPILAQQKLPEPAHQN